MQLRALALACLAWQAGFALAQPLHSGIDRSAFDATVRIQDDLFSAVNGQWLKDTPIPPDKSRFGTFIELRDQADARVRALVDELAATPAEPGTNRHKIGAFYRSFTDEAAIDKAGLAPLSPWLSRIDGVASRTDLAALMGRLQGVASTPLLVDVDADPKEPGIYRAVAWQGGLGLPDREYYLASGERHDKARAAYRAYLETVFSLAGDRSAKAHAARVFAVEKRLAQAQWTRVANRDPLKTYNPTTLAALNRRAPGLAWNAYFEGAALPVVDRVSVGQPAYATALARAVKDVPLATWKLYLRARLLDAQAPVLPQAFRDAHFAFHGTALQGTEQQRPRWQLAITALDGALGEAVGEVYVARHFPAAHKARMLELVGNLKAAFTQSIDGLTWMTPPTRMRAKEKLARYDLKIGYPDRWRDYTALEVREGDALGNAVRAGRFEHERRARRVGQPVDRTEWGMTPQTVNAYFNPTLNEIVFPAGILAPPFFDMGADDAMNYGAIAAVIGHEISHGFDDQGSRYNGEGKLENWWTPEDRKAFDALGARLVAQYDAYEALPGQRVNGQLTLGENIADLSGLQVAFKAYQASLDGKPAPVIDGLTGEQRFFMAWAQAWRMKTRDAFLSQQLTTDPHSPARYRANGPVVNHDGFHDHFQTKPGDGMHKPPAERIRIW